MVDFTFTTERLLLRPWQMTDVPHCLELAKDIGYHAFSIPGTFLVESPAHAATIVMQKCQQFEKTGLGVFPIFQKDTGTFVGTCGLDDFTFEGTSGVEIHCRLLLRYWGKGYATEMTPVVLLYGFETLHLDEIYSFVLAQNRASHDVMSKLGLIYVKDVTCAGEPHRMYAAKSWFKPRLFQSCRHPSYWHAPRS